MILGGLQCFSLVDLLPTTLGAVGLDVPSYCQGTDFSPLLRGEEFCGPDTVLLEMCGGKGYWLDQMDWRGFTTRRWKYAFYENGRELLYDLEVDPFEQNNLAAGNPDRCEEFRKKLLAELNASREPYFDVLMNNLMVSDKPDLTVRNGVAEPHVYMPVF